MASPMIKTSTPGIYKRGSRYVCVFRVNGRQRKESVATMREAQRLKAVRTADIARGEFQEASRLRFAEYAREWVGRYQGRGSQGFRETTREDYASLLERFAIPFFDERLGRRLSHVSPRDVANFVAWLCDESAQNRRLADSTVRNVLNPVRACLRSAVAEGLIRANPAAGVALPNRFDPEADEDEGPVEILSGEQLAFFLAVVDQRHRALFELLASTGLRISEALALQWRHLDLDSDRLRVRVRRAFVRGHVHAPKTRYARRDVPLSTEVASRLYAHRDAVPSAAQTALVFPSQAGTHLRQENLRRRTLVPAAGEAGVPSMGFHVLRHTLASMLFERGGNAVQVQRWLGHHSPAFTLQTYVHLLSDDLGEGIAPPALASGAGAGCVS